MQLGRYQILKQLSTGGIADVLLARATGLEGFARHVVIKRIRGELATEPRFVNAFLEEARIAASLHHQNIVQVHDIGEQEGTYFFAMEYVHGEDVGKLLQRVRERGEHIPFDLVVAIVSATAAGLHHAHEQRDSAGHPLGLVHRDVTPSNILIGYDGSVKLVDFGLAKAARSTKTASATLTGKASYLAPEQCVGKPVDRRTDVFSLGVVLFELATACRLFKAANDFLTMAVIVEGEIPAPSTFRPEIPPALDAIVLRALARDPDSRFQTVEDLREALERFALEYELRISNKALADYLAALFGVRPEPWHDEAAGNTAEPDPTHGKGLVAPPTDNSAVIQRLAPRATSPIMLAQAAIEEDADSDEFIDDFETFVLRKSSELAVMAAPRGAATPAPTPAASRPPTPAPSRTPTPPRVPTEPPLEEDPFGKTIVTPPPKFDTTGDIGSATPVRDIADMDTNPPLRHIGELDSNPAMRRIAEVESNPAMRRIADLATNRPRDIGDMDTPPARDIADMDTNIADMDTPIREIDAETPIVPLSEVESVIAASRPPSVVTASSRPSSSVPTSRASSSVVTSRPSSDSATSRPSSSVAAPLPRSSSPFDDGLKPRPEPSLETPPRPASELMYVGPPAPPAKRGPIRKFLAYYGRSIAIGAGAGFLVVAMATVVFHACSPPRHKHRPPPVSAPSR